jgi:hypothetical protein
MAEHSVIVTFTYADQSPKPLFSLEDRLREAIDAAGVGEFDGNELASDLSDGTMYMYGPDAEALFHVVRPLLAEATCFRTAAATLRFGPPADGVPERTVEVKS